MSFLYKYPAALVPGTLIKRYKRFLCDVRLEDGSTIQAFCPNSGSMLGLAVEGTPAMLCPASMPTMDYRLELVQSGRAWVGVNTHLTNHLARALVDSGLLEGYCIERAEVKVGLSRLDFALHGPDGKRAYMEVKSVTLRGEGHTAQFPDAVTSRGLKHLHELSALCELGHAAFMLFVVQRGDCRSFSPATHIDPAYANGLAQAMQKGVRVVVHQVRLSVRGVQSMGSLPFSVD